MKREIINGKIWEFDTDIIEGDVLIIAKSGDSTFADWVDMEHCRLGDGERPKRSSGGAGTCTDHCAAVR